MFTENDFMTPRERVNDALRKRMLDAQNTTQLGCGRDDAMGGTCFERDTQRRDSSCEERRDGYPLCEDSHDSHAGRKSWGLENYPLASVFAPLQCWRNLYDLETGLSRGTIFKELDLPFVCGDRKGGNCRGR
jgi:hypothetical protein